MEAVVKGVGGHVWRGSGLVLRGTAVFLMGIVSGVAALIGAGLILSIVLPLAWLVAIPLHGIGGLAGDILGGALLVIALLCVVAAGGLTVRLLMREVAGALGIWKPFGVAAGLLSYVVGLAFLALLIYGFASCLGATDCAMP